MARLYRLFLLVIALVTIQHSFAIAEDGPGKPNPIKARILKAANSTDLLPIRGPIEPLRSRLFLKDNKPTGPDPIRFVMRASKDSVAVGEEFEITITAQLLVLLQFSG